MSLAPAATSTPSGVGSGSGVGRALSAGRIRIAAAAVSTPVAPSPALGQPQPATWNIKQWKKHQEPQRNKTHWDYLLEEMEWLSKDFREERNWKAAVARKAVKAVSRWHLGRGRVEERGEQQQQHEVGSVESAALSAHD